ncbi:MAG: two-component sensor histidine kinase, partial [Nocardioidaceae bacterium]|nr:two-component sensor histidine kinase [Nocardioidaceae bacterium]
MPEVRWRYRRSLASRVIWLTTIAVGLSVALVAVGAYFTARVQMQHALDDALLNRANKAAASDSLFAAGSQGIPSWALGAADVRIAFFDFDGKIAVLDRGPTMDLGPPELEVARGHHDYNL